MRQCERRQSSILMGCQSSQASQSLAGEKLVFEHWRDQAALDALLNEPHVKAHFTKWTSRMVSIGVQSGL